MPSSNQQQQWGAKLRSLLREYAERISPFGQGDNNTSNGSSSDWMLPENRPERLRDRAVGTMRPIRTSTWYFQRATLIWNILLYSLLLEVVVLNLQIAIPAPLPPESSAMLDYVGWGLLGFAALFLLPEATHWADQVFKGIQWLSTNRRVANHVISLAVALIAAIKLFNSFGDFGLIALLVIGIVAVGAMQSLLRQHSAETKRIESILGDPMRWIELRNYQNFLVSLLPIVAIRIATLLFAANCLIQRSDFAQFAPYLGIAMMLAFSVRPRPAIFIARCGGCARWTSRALLGFGCCPACAPHLFAQRQ